MLQIKRRKQGGCEVHMSRTQKQVTVLECKGVTGNLYKEDRQTTLQKLQVLRHSVRSRHEETPRKCAHAGKLNSLQNGPRSQLRHQESTLLTYSQKGWPRAGIYTMWNRFLFHGTAANPPWLDSFWATNGLAGDCVSPALLHNCHSDQTLLS